MRFRSCLFALPLLMIAAPAAAQDIAFVPGTGNDVEVTSFETAPSRQKGEDTQILDLADKLADPAMQDGVSAAIERMTSTMLQLPVGQFAAAIEDARPGTVNKRIRRDATIAELAGRDVDRLPEQLAGGTRQMMGMASGFARAFAAMMPELENMGREMEESFRAAKAQARQR